MTCTYTNICISNLSHRTTAMVVFSGGGKEPCHNVEMATHLYQIKNIVLHCYVGDLQSVLSSDVIE